MCGDLSKTHEIGLENFLEDKVRQLASEDEEKHAEIFRNIFTEPVPKVRSSLFPFSFLTHFYLLLHPCSFM